LTRTDGGKLAAVYERQSSSSKSSCLTSCGTQFLHFEIRTARCYSITTANSGFEGAVSKLRNAGYISGLSRHWVKTKCPDWKRDNAERWRIFNQPAQSL
jgi:hypothetical protein